MRFDNRDVKIAAELLGSFARQPEKHIDSDAEIRCEHDRQRLRGLFDRAALLCRVTGGPNDQWLAMLRDALAKNYDRLDAVLAAMQTAERKDMP